MGLGINLRGDLAKLSDAELAARLEQAWRAHQAAKSSVPRIDVWCSRRGPIRHPWAYHWLSFAGASGPFFYFYFGLGPFIRTTTWMDVHLTLCEIRDLNDEIKRRTRRAKGSRR